MNSESAMSNPAASFEPFRRRLLGLAYRMLGSMADAEDAVQETYLRWHAADRDNVSDPKAFLVSHLAERDPNRFLASVDVVLSEDRWQMAHRARPGLSACRSGERQSVAEPRALRA